MKPIIDGIVNGFMFWVIAIILFVICGFIFS